MSQFTPEFFAAVILNSKHPEKLAAFYEKALGLTMRKRGEEFSAIVGETHFAIHSVGAGNKSVGGSEIGLHFKDLDGLVKALTEKGVAIDDPIREYPWARSARILDPDGNVIYLMQIPRSSLEELAKLRRSRG